MRAQGELIVQLRNVGKVFQTDALQHHVLAGINLDVGRGEFLSIAGPSGCGKTTLLSLLGLLDTPTDGQLWFDGMRVDTLARQERARLRNGRVGFVFQAFNLIGDLTVAQNVALPLTFRADLTRRERQERVEEVLSEVCMTHRMKSYPSQLSGGQQQRVAVARALVGRPSILLADEPTGNLDLRNGEIVMGLLSHLHAAGQTVCMVTHDERFRSLADRAVFLLDGRVVDEKRFRDIQAETDCGLDDPRVRAMLP